MSNIPENAVSETAAASCLSVAVFSHNGAVRPNNEDNFFVNGYTRKIEDNVVSFSEIMPSDGLLLEVCDGMGGEAMGEVASDIAVKHCGLLFENLKNTGTADLLDEVNRYIESANSEICQTIGNTESRRGGSTFVLAYFKNDVVYPYSLGDSRLYAFNGTKLVQISEDHTLGMRKFKSNICSYEEAMTGPDSHKLTLFLGVDVNNDGLSAQPYRPFRVEKGWKLLLCSDGLYDMVPGYEIAEILKSEPAEACRTLVDCAVAHGGMDNVTCIVAEMR